MVIFMHVTTFKKLAVLKNWPEALLLEQLKDSGEALLGSASRGTEQEKKYREQLWGGGETSTSIQQVQLTTSAGEPREVPSLGLSSPTIKSPTYVSWQTHVYT